MKCTFIIREPWDILPRFITVYKSSFELKYEFLGYRFKFDHFLNTSYQHAYYEET